MPGGTAFYFTHALRLMPELSYKLVTSVGESELHEVEKLRKLGIEAEVIPSRKSVFFENKYGEDSNERTQRVLAKADPFTIESVDSLNARYYHLGTLLADDFSLDVIKHLSRKGILSVDAQGYLREVRGENVFAIDWNEKKEAAKYIHILKANEHEMEVLTGEKDPEEAALILADWGIKEVLLTLGSLGSIIYSDNVFHHIPAYPAKEIVDATGCGDTYMAAYLYKRSKGASVTEAGKFAAAMCTLKIQNSGPFQGTISDVENVIGI
jgi:sugar/nucleoside kinase (ribokinase family)